MKKMMQTMREVFDELKKDIGFYMAIQRYSRVSRKFKKVSVNETD